MKKFPVFDNGRWRISAYRNANTGQPSLFVENLKTGLCDYPICYGGPGYRVAYDYPERIPEYVHKVVRSLLASPRNDKWVRLCDCVSAVVI